MISKHLAFATNHLANTDKTNYDLWPWTTQSPKQQRLKTINISRN